MRRLSLTGVVESIAFATSKEIFLLKLETGGSNKSSSPTLDLSRVLDQRYSTWRNFAYFSGAQSGLASYLRRTHAHTVQIWDDSD